MGVFHRQVSRETCRLAGPSTWHGVFHRQVSRETWRLVRRPRLLLLDETPAEEMERCVGERSPALRYEPAGGLGCPPEDEHPPSRFDHRLDILEGESQRPQRGCVGELRGPVGGMPGAEDFDVGTSHHPRRFPQESPAVLTRLQQRHRNRIQQDRQDKSRRAIARTDIEERSRLHLRKRGQRVLDQELDSIRVGPSTREIDALAPARDEVEIACERIDESRGEPERCEGGTMVLRASQRGPLFRLCPAPLRRRGRRSPADCSLPPRCRCARPALPSARRG